MHTVFVKYVLPESVPRAVMAEKFRAASPKFRNVPGLIRKQFGYDEESHTGYSVYVWESEANARAFFSPEFVANFEKSFGTTPQLQFIDTLCVVDNQTENSEAA